MTTETKCEQKQKEFLLTTKRLIAHTSEPIAPEFKQDPHLYQAVCSGRETDELSPEIFNKDIGGERMLLSTTNINVITQLKRPTIVYFGCKIGQYVVFNETYMHIPEEFWTMDVPRINPEKMTFSVQKLKSVWNRTQEHWEISVRQQGTIEVIEWNSDFHTFTPKIIRRQGDWKIFERSVPVDEVAILLAWRISVPMVNDKPHGLLEATWSYGDKEEKYNGYYFNGKFISHANIKRYINNLCNQNGWLLPVLTTEIMSFLLEPLEYFL